MSFMLPKLDSNLFDWLTWISGSPLDLIGYCHCRTSDVIKYRLIIKQYAIGYCDAETIPCRPKLNWKSVMFLKDDNYFWFHLSNYEFNCIFKGESK